MLILGIETSCDETAAAILEACPERSRGVKKSSFKVRSSVVLSQINIHCRFGGVVPEVAARKHLENVLPVVDQALREAKTNWPKIDAIAVTRGPGLITSLMVGVQTAKTLSYIYNKPLIPINHLEAHILANQLTNFDLNKNLPAISLIVSGGHTELILIKKIGRYQIIGQTLDDAAGECFDKVAKILNIGYPGGPIISQLAKNGHAAKYPLPRPMIDQPNFNFSFSGLKTSVLYFVQKNGRPEKKALNDFCASVEQSIVDVLASKTIAAAKKFKAKSITLGGGVAANPKLREQLGQRIKTVLPNTKYQIPNTEYCTDNAAMIAVAGYYNFKKTSKSSWANVKIDPNLSL
ncbi:MAG: tRNA (adenosine(37)-N6)-threonylcarbamoyltransferase complex transferase subunit TsaD [Patescibacteria group bacterium]